MVMQSNAKSKSVEQRIGWSLKVLAAMVFIALCVATNGSVLFRHRATWSDVIILFAMLLWGVGLYFAKGKPILSPPAAHKLNFRLFVVTFALFLVLWVPLYWNKPGPAMILMWVLWGFEFICVIYSKICPPKN
jgi:hypothetical protein